MKVIDLTPKEFNCMAGACPKVFETDRGTVIVIGRVLGYQEQSQLPTGTLGEGEAAVELPKGIVANLRFE
jgi:hypothetical protein